MTGAAWALQQAVFATLVASDAVHTIVADRVFDAVPRGSAFPYIVIGDATETDAGAAASEHALDIRIWSRGGGSREGKLAAAAVREALDGAALSLDGHTLIDIAFVSADFARETDGETWCATLRFRAVTEPRE